MKKRINDIVFDPSMQPGHKTRYVSLDGLMGPRVNDDTQEKGNASEMFKESENPYKKYKSLQNPMVKPSVILRKKGFNPY